MKPMTNLLSTGHSNLVSDFCDGLIQMYSSVGARNHTDACVKQSQWPLNQ